MFVMGASELLLLPYYSSCFCCSCYCWTEYIVVDRLIFLIRSGIFFDALYFFCWSFTPPNWLILTVSSRRMPFVNVFFWICRFDEIDSKSNQIVLCYIVSVSLNMLYKRFLIHAVWHMWKSYMLFCECIVPMLNYITCLHLVVYCMISGVITFYYIPFKLCFIIK